MTPQQPPSDGSATDPLIGRVLDGRYRILDRIASGGMATIHRAQDLRLDRIVAVKMMHPSLAADAAFSERFIHEARAAAQLAHPNVVAIYDQGKDERDAQLYLVMEYVDGSTLRELIRTEAPLPPVRALHLAREVLLALAAAHSAGLVHRDVKPENVLISATGRVKVADFGLAKAVSADTQHTATGGVLIGTVSYLAPELVVEGRIDPRVDVYASGVLLFEMLTGVKPHDGETPIQIAWAHVHTDVPAPSTLVPGLPDYVDALVARATARDRTLRPADASVLLRHIDRVRQALSTGVTSDPELTADLTPLTLNPATGQLGSTAAAPDPFGTAALSAIGGTQDIPLLTDVSLPPTEVGTGQPDHAEPTRSLGESTAVLRPGSAPLPVRGPENTAVVPRDDIPLAPAPGSLRESRRAAAARLKAQRKAERRAQKLQDGPAASAPGPAQDTAAPQRSRRGPLLLIAALVVALTVGAGAWWFGWARYTDTPGVLGLSENQAIGKIREAGLTVDQGTPVFSESVPKGRIVRTEPGRGERILNDGTVTLFVSKGPERYPVPEVRGLGQVEAEDALRANNLAIADVSHRWSETVAQDLVISSDPAAGASLRRGDKVALVISKGRRPWPVLDQTGRTQAQATKKLGKRFDVQVTEEFHDTVPRGEVISQFPDSGTLFRGDTVALKVSKGPVLVDVPNVLSDNVDDAVDELEAKGFVVKIDDSLDLGLDRVYKQSPFNDKAPKGSTVTLWVA